MLLFWPVVIPFATAVLTLLARRSAPLQRLISLAGALALLAVSIVIARAVAASGPFAQQAGAWPAPFGISMVADTLSATLLILVAIVAVAAVVYGFADVTRREEALGHHALVHGMLAGVCGAFLTGDLFNMYVWFEVMLIASFGLLVIGGERDELDGAVKYVALNLIATVAFLSGVGLLYGATGALNMADLHGRLAGRVMETPVAAAAAFLLFAFAAKAALFPLFFWLPASYHTPSFTTSALFAALLTKVGVYAIMRVFTLVLPLWDTPLQALLVWGSVLSMLLGAFGAIVMPSVRRVLGFTVIASIGGILLGLAIGSAIAVTAALVYLFQDILVKAALFFGAGAAARLTGSERLLGSGGLWRQRPWFALAFLVPALALAGMPPFSGFWPKLLLVQATIVDGRFGLMASVLVAGLLTLLAVARLWSEAIWAAHPDGPTAIRASLSPAMVAPIALMAVAITVLGVVAAPLIDVAGESAADLLDPARYIAAVLGSAP